MTYFIIAGVILFDQLTKWAVLDRFSDGSSMVLTSFFNMILAYNTGISFSMFSNGGQWGSYALTVVALGICLFLIRWMHQEKDTWIKCALAGVVGGAVGNVIDRTLYGAVVDFLDFHAFGYHWPAFNIADAAICVGAAIIVYRTIFKKGK